MDSKVSYTIVGIFVVVLSAAFIIMFFWLSGARHDKTYNTYLSYVHEDVTGLSLRGPVRFNGVQVGYVSSIALDSRNPQFVKIVFEIEEGTPITTSTIVTLMPMGITGVVYAGLKAETPNAPLLGAKPGEQYPVIPFQPSFLTQLSNVLPELTKNLKEISQSISKVFDEKNRLAFSETLQNISTVTKSFSDDSHKLSEIVSALQRTLDNTSKASEQFPQLMDELHATMQNIQKTSVQINAASRGAKHMLDQGATMIDSLNTQLLPSAQQMLVKMNVFMLNLANITRDMQSNPSMLIRGKQPAIPGPGEGR